MNFTPILSICIPTYNRSNELRGLLECIFKQIKNNYTDLVEITISDNASIDDTQEMVKNLMNDYPSINLVYNCNTQNLGPDRNFLKSVELAHGKYAWIMGSDDELNEDAITNVINELKSEETVYICGRDIYYQSFDTEKVRTEFFFKKYFVDKGMVYKFRTVSDWDFYLSSCTRLGAVMSYLSAVIFKKSEWDQININNSYIGTAYVHVYVILSMLLKNKKGTLKLLSKPLVKTRFGNDSFSSNAFKRLMIDFRGYEKIADLFENNTLKKDLFEIVRRESETIAVRIILKANKNEFSELVTRMQKIGYPNEYINLVKRLYKHKLLTTILYIDKFVKFILRRK